MMQRPSDELLVAYLDGELDEAQFTEVGDWLDRDSSLRARLTSLSETTALIREAFEPVLREPVPEQLFAATHAKEEDSNVVAFTPKPAPARVVGHSKRWWLTMAVAASFACFVMGASFRPLVDTNVTGESDKPLEAKLDNFAGYHFDLVNKAEAVTPADFWISPETNDGKLPSNIILPDLKPWGLVYVGGRLLKSDGKPCYQFTYTTDNKELGPVTIFVTTSAEPDVQPTYETRDNVNFLFWRHRGHGYYIVGGANKGWMWQLKNDIAYQLKAM
jgi:anti-sigma factor RsiW